MLSHSGLGSSGTARLRGLSDPSGGLSISLRSQRTYESLYQYPSLPDT